MSSDLLGRKVRNGRDFRRAGALAVTSAGGHRLAAVPRGEFAYIPVTPFGHRTGQLVLDGLITAGVTNSERMWRMSREDSGRTRVEMGCEQELFLVIAGKGQMATITRDDDHLIAFESLWHAGSLVHELEALGRTARSVTIPLEAAYYLAKGMDLRLWLLRYDGTVLSVDDIAFR